MPRPRAVIFVNGDLPDPPALLPFIKMDDFIMAADGGLKHIDNLHLHPHLVIGDMDSISPDRLKALHDTTEIVRYPQQRMRPILNWLCRLQSDATSGRL